MVIGISEEKGPRINGRVQNLPTIKAPHKVNTFIKLFNVIKASNGNRGRETPDPIPNSEAKLVHDMCVLP